MHPTLVNIPSGIFGFGWGLAVWAAASAALLLWHGRRAGWLAALKADGPSIILVGATIAYVLPRLATEQGLPIRGYGVMVVLGIAAGVGLSVWRARRVGLDAEVILNLAFWLFCFGMVGARLFYVIEYWDEKFHKSTVAETVRAIFDFTGGGLVVFGALLAGLLGVWLFTRRHSLPLLAVADLIAPGMVLGLALGRIGCFFTGCCYGGICALPWAISFPGPSAAAPEGSPVYADQARSGVLFGIVFKSDRGPDLDPPIIERVLPGSPAAQAGLKPGDRIDAIVDFNRHVPIRTVHEARKNLVERVAEGQDVRLTTAADSRARTLSLPRRSQTVHPTQIYASIDAVVLLLFLLALDPFCRRDGALFAAMLTLHSVSRFLLEIVRIDESAVFHTGLSISQNISILLCVAAAVMWVYVLGGPKRRAFADR